MIDWKNKPDGAQRYNKDLHSMWLKRDEKGVSYWERHFSIWIIYANQTRALLHWENAIPQPSDTPPLQLVWNDAPVESTHILQHSTSLTQVFATMTGYKFYSTKGNLLDRNWFIVSVRPVETVDSTINERGERYGKFNEGANIMQTLKNVMRETDGWERLTPSQREALEMIQHKIGRVLNGDPTYDDNWRDICGYSQLILDELNGTKR